jgi:hypothetical protein
LNDSPKEGTSIMVVTRCLAHTPAFFFITTASSGFISENDFFLIA